MQQRSSTKKVIRNNIKKKKIIKINCNDLINLIRCDIKIIHSLLIFAISSFWQIKNITIFIKNLEILILDRRMKVRLCNTKKKYVIKINHIVYCKYMII